MIYLTVGEIAKVLDISTEMIRFYVREGIITPKKNEQNNYWEYSSDDVMMLSDILFYRDQELTINDIRSIFDGLEVEKIGNIIEERKAEALENIEKYQRMLKKLEDWQENYEDELSLLGNFRICAMPQTLRKPGYFDEESHLAQYLSDGIPIAKEQWRDVSLSFYCNIHEDEIRFQRYLSINKPLQINDSIIEEDIIEESAEKCICTQVRYSDDLMEMVRPVIDYAIRNGYRLTGGIYAWENTNYYVDGKRMALYRIYAPIE